MGQDFFEGAASSALKTLGVSGGDLLWVKADPNQVARTAPRAAEPAQPAAALLEEATTVQLQPSSPVLQAAGALDVHCVPQELLQPMQQDAAAGAQAPGVQAGSDLAQPNSLSRVLHQYPVPGSPADALLLFTHAVLLESGLQLCSEVGSPGRLTLS